MPATGLPFLCVCPCPFVLQTKPLLSTRTLPCLCLPSAAVSLILIGLHFPQCCCNAATKPVTPRPAPSSPLWRQQPPRPSPSLTNFFLPHIFSFPVHPTASASFARVTSASSAGATASHAAAPLSRVSTVSARLSSSHSCCQQVDVPRCPAAGEFWLPAAAADLLQVFNHRNKSKAGWDAACLYECIACCLLVSCRLNALVQAAACSAT